MARTLTPASDSSVLRRHPKLTYQSGPFTTSVQHRAADFGIAVADGTQTRDAVLQWAFGSGDIGQSYVWKAENGFREARFNFFSSLDGLAATPGRLQGAPTTLDMAVGRPLEEFEARTCFGCHTSALSSATPLDLHSMIAGVTCEGCHGPGAEHIAAVMQSSGAPEKHWDRHIVNAGRMTPEEQVDFCGACHSTPWDVRAMGAVGLPTVRFPAYRLEKSRCWGAAGNKRVTCTACHDPHQPLAREASAYDHACLACHATSPHAKTTAERPGAACSVATSKCTSCHMPKYELPEMHARFTDHMIRIARAGEALPD